MNAVQRLVIVALAAGTALIMGFSSAQAAPRPAPTHAQILAALARPAQTMTGLEQQNALQLRLAPGGRQTAPHEVSYDGGKVVITVAMPGAARAAAAGGYPDCPAQWFCFYDGPNWTYPRGKLSDCGWQDLGRYGWNDRTESVDNYTANDIDFYNHNDRGNPANMHALD